MATPYFYINPLPLQIYPPSSKTFCPPPPLSQVTQLLEGPTPNDVIVVVLKDTILFLVGFRFIYIVYIS